MRQHTTFSTTVTDLSGTSAAYVASLDMIAEAAGRMWAQYLYGYGNVEIKLTIENTAAGTADGGSATSVYRDTVGGINVYQWGAVSEIATGLDPNGATADVNIRFDPDYLAGLWFDPNPDDAIRDVPLNRTDAFSVMLHEIGHALGFNGWRDWTTSNLASNYMSPYDEHISISNGSLFFSGFATTSVYGGPVGLTLKNGAHYGNDGGPGDELIEYGLMNGVVFYYGRAYQILNLDLAILADTGTNIGIDVQGTNSSEQILGTPGSDFLIGAAGNDTLLGGYGADFIYGNLDADLIYGNGSDDDIYGGQGTDTLFGGQGADLVYGNFQNDVIYGNFQNHTLYGGQGNDWIYGGQGDDVINGNQGDDVLIGNLGADRFVFGPNSGSDIILGFNFAAGDRIDLLGQTVASTGTASDGDLILFLSGAGVVLLDGLKPSDFSNAFFV